MQVENFHEEFDHRQRLKPQNIAITNLRALQRDNQMNNCGQIVEKIAYCSIYDKMILE